MREWVARLGKNSYGSYVEAVMNNLGDSDQSVS
jgi:hypothetical protein